MKKILNDLHRSYKQYLRYQKTLRELAALSDRELNDLGLARCDIPFVARKSVYKGAYA